MALDEDSVTEVLRRFIRLQPPFDDFGFDLGRKEGENAFGTLGFGAGRTPQFVFTIDALRVHVIQ